MQFYGGTKQAVTGAGRRARAAAICRASCSSAATTCKLPYGDFVSNLAILRVDYAVSPRATVRSLTQYNSLTHEVTNSVRFNFIYRPGSDIYIVYNDLQQTGLPHGASSRRPTASSSSR